MKKKFFIAALAATVFATSALGLAACSKDSTATGDGGGGDGGGKAPYTITLDANGGAFSGGATTKTVMTDKSGKLAAKPSAPEQAKQDCTFVGWGRSASTSFTIDSFSFDNSCTIYAVWKTDQGGGGGGGGEETVEYKITFDANGGTFTEDTEPVVKETIDGRITNAMLPDVAYADHTLVGWYTAKTGGALVTSYAFTESMTVYAVWKENGGGTTTLPLDNMVAVESGEQQTGKPNMYVVGSFGGSGIQEEFGYFAEFAEGTYGPEYRAPDIHLDKDDLVVMYAPSWTFYCAVIESGCTVTEFIEVVTENGRNYFKILKSGTYSFYLKNEFENDRIWIDVTPD